MIFDKEDKDLELDADLQVDNNISEIKDGLITQNDRPNNEFLSSMYRSWFLDYSSYVIRSRAVPHIDDGLKPVQRRILYNMHLLDTGKLIKVQNIAGTTMKFHPHGDASINDAIVQLGQKGYLIDTQGNWGNILTGDSAAAGRYIEAKLSNFANEALFSDKITEWKKTYDGAIDEPVSLPVKFPLLLVQGAEGIAVGLSSKILPHNFVEISEAAISYLKGEEFNIYPDFPTGGYIDVSKYENGRRGGSIKSRAKIEKIDNKTLSISELPAGKTTQSLIDSILKAVDKGKIKIKKIDDMTAAEADIRITLASGVSSDKAISALYAFTDCEVSISPICCVIKDDKPLFCNVEELLKYNVDKTKDIFAKELNIKLSEKEEAFLNASLERIFIEERIYKDKEFEEAKDEISALEHIDNRLESYKDKFIYEISNEHLRKLLEIKMARILKFNLAKHEKEIAQLTQEIEDIKKDLANIKAYTIRWFEHLIDRYGDKYPRLSKITNFTSIEATKVAEKDEKLYVDRKGRFYGTGLKDAEFICNVSSIDDIIIFFRSGKFVISKVEDKKFYGDEELIHIAPFVKNDDRTIYNVVYRDGSKGAYYIKRFNVTSFTRDKEYDISAGTEGSKVVYFTANGNGEAETIRVYLNTKNPRQRIFQFDRSFSEIQIKGRSAKGNLFTKADIKRISMISEGESTLGGRKVWFDKDVNKLNYNGHGELLGTFYSKDQVFVLLKSGEFYTTTFSDTNHFEDNIDKIEKFNPEKIYTALYLDGENGYLYLKRFNIEPNQNKQSILGDDLDAKLIHLTDNYYARFLINWGGEDAHRKEIEIEANDFVGIKSTKAKGKRIATYSFASFEELEPSQENPYSDNINEDIENEDNFEVMDNEDETTIQFEGFSNEDE